MDWGGEVRDDAVRNDFYFIIPDKESQSIRKREEKKEKDHLSIQKQGIMRIPFFKNTLDKIVIEIGRLKKNDDRNSELTSKNLFTFCEK